MGAVAEAWPCAWALVVTAAASPAPAAPTTVRREIVLPLSLLTQISRILL